MDYGILAHEYRGGILDTVHFGCLAVVDEYSRVRFNIGNPDGAVFYRSASKPIQALPAIAMGLDEKYGLTPEETVLFAGSHTGDAIHVAAAESMMKKAGLPEDALVMKPTAPARNERDEERIRAGTPLRKYYHNCAGKHIALLLTQRELGGDIRDYWKIGSPAELEAERVVRVMGESGEMGLGVDGCGVPVFATGIKNIAIAFRNLATPDRIRDDGLQEAAMAYVPRIGIYPHMMRGEGYLCTALNHDPNIVAKGGANGVYGFGLKKERLGIAFKLIDGTEKARTLIVMEILRGLGALTPETEERILTLSPSEIRNDNDDVVGVRETAFKLVL